MSDLDEASLDSIERRLAARAGVAVPAEHRDRVLAAVRDTLDQRHGPPPPAGSGIDAGATAALVAISLSAGLLIVAPWVAMTRSAAPFPAEPRLVAEARAAGIDLPVATVAATNGQPLGAPSRAAMSDLLDRRHEAWRMRNLLPGEL